MLQQELDRAQVVASIDVPATVVTLDSRVRLRNLDTGEDEMYTLVLPQNSDFARKRISVLAPIGTAVLGYQVGDVIEWEVPGGKRRLRVEEILFQPERAARASGGNALFVEENEKCQQPAPAC
jgi:regulator of nucleoside diphosphate kinase